MILNGRGRARVRGAALVAKIERMPTARFGVKGESGYKLFDSLLKSPELRFAIRHATPPPYQRTSPTPYFGSPEKSHCASAFVGSHAAPADAHMHRIV
jgi:hypothetical protein